MNKPKILQMTTHCLILILCRVHLLTIIRRDISDDEVFSFDISPVTSNKEEPINDKTTRNQSVKTKSTAPSESQEFEEQDLDSISSSISSAEDSLVVKEKETKKLHRVPNRDRSLSLSEKSFSETRFPGFPSN